MLETILIIGILAVVVISLVTGKGGG